MSDYEKLKESYKRLLKDTKDVAKLKLRIRELEKDKERLERIINLRNKEIIELSLLVMEKIK